jgi:hypothetical protein
MDTVVIIGIVLLVLLVVVFPLVCSAFNFFFENKEDKKEAA